MYFQLAFKVWATEKKRKKKKKPVGGKAKSPDFPTTDPGQWHPFGHWPSTLK